MPAHQRAPALCRQCGQMIGSLPSADEFCCRGCAVVYQILGTRELNLNNLIDDKVKTHHRELDHPDIQGEYVSGDGQTLSFYLPGVHCASCIAIIEKLPQISTDAQTAQLDLSSSTVTVKKTVTGRFSRIAQALEVLGYQPLPIKNGENITAHMRRSNRQALIRCGVAGALAGNIMMLSSAVYFGADGAYLYFFNLLSLILFLPILLWLTVPFYRETLTALKLHTLSISLPVTVAVLFGFIISTWNFVGGRDHLYFDSLAALVFLLLSTRYLLKRIQQSHLATSAMHHSYLPALCQRWSGSSWQSWPTRSLKSGDTIRVRSNEIIPVDGQITAGSSELNAAVITGESVPLAVKPGDTALAGMENLGQEIIVRVELTSGQTRLDQILAGVERESLRQSTFVQAADRAANYLLLAIFAIAAALIFYFAPSYWPEGLQRALALTIMACPCALAIATPLTFALALRHASAFGIFIKKGVALEKIPTLRHLFIDKTGTLSTGRFTVVRSAPAVLSAWQKSAIAQLEAQSQHPMARALRTYVGTPAVPICVEDVQEVPGHGVSGKITGQHCSLRQLTHSADAHFSQVGFFVTDGSTDGSADKLVATFWLRDELRPEALAFVDECRARDFSVTILSGDNHEPVAQIATELAVPPDHALAHQSPEDKHLRLLKSHHSMMIGDGANDALALAAADVGVAVRGSMGMSLKACDVYLTQPNLSAILALFDLSQTMRKVLRRNIAVSLVYNAIGMSLAVSGFIHPIAAAILMPVSSLTVLLSAFYGGRQFAHTLQRRMA